MPTKKAGFSGETVFVGMTKCFSMNVQMLFNVSLSEIFITMRCQKDSSELPSIAYFLNFVKF